MGQPLVGCRPGCWSHRAAAGGRHKSLARADRGGRVGGSDTRRDPRAQLACGGSRMTIDQLPVAFAETLATFARVTGETPIRVLDASCHEGHGLRRLGQLWECPTFGCEPSEAVHAARLGTTRVVRE